MKQNSNLIDYTRDNTNNKYWMPTTQNTAATRIQQTNDGGDDDDFTDTMKGTISVTVGASLFCILFGYIIFKAAESANIANVEIKFREEKKKKTLIRNTSEFLERNGFVDKGLSPFYKFYIGAADNNLNY